jgi:hypothetical protein
MEHGAIGGTTLIQGRPAASPMRPIPQRYAGGTVILPVGRRVPESRPG